MKAQANTTKEQSNKKSKQIGDPSHSGNGGIGGKKPMMTSLFSYINYQRDVLWGYDVQWGSDGSECDEIATFYQHCYLVFF